jgi:hypothetical protein
VGEQKSGLEDLIADYEQKVGKASSVLLAEATEEERGACSAVIARLLEGRLRMISNQERDAIRQSALDEAHSDYLR